MEKKVWNKNEIECQVSVLWFRRFRALNQLAQDISFCLCCAQHAGGRVTMQGLENTTMFCGDGINDLAALSAADVGMSIGDTDAVIAADISTNQGSVAGHH